MINVGDRVIVKDTGTIWDGKEGTVEWIDENEKELVDGGDVTTVLVAIEFETEGGSMKTVRQEFDRGNLESLNNDEAEIDNDVVDDDIQFENDFDDESDGADEDNEQIDVESLTEEYADKYTQKNYRVIFESVLERCKNEDIAFNVMDKLNDLYINNKEDDYKDEVL